MFAVPATISLAAAAVATTVTLGVGLGGAVTSAFVPPVAPPVLPSFATRQSQSHRRSRRAHRGLAVGTDLSSSRYGGGDHRSALPRDVVVVGGGLAGLSIAHRIATTSSRHVTVLDRETPELQRGKTVAGSFAAAGMLAPQAERLPSGSLLDLSLASRSMYAEFVRDVEGGARDASLGAPSRGGGRRYGGEGAKYLWELTDELGIPPSFDGGLSPPLEPWEVGFHAAGGFLAPAFAGDAVSTWAPQQSADSGAAMWLDDVQVRELEPMLHPSVIGGWWFPEDASVDARRLTCSLRAACVGAGVQMMFGEEYAVGSLDMSGKECKGVYLANGKVLAPRSVVVANGSWMRQLLPVPIVPHKGQSISLRMPPNTPPLLSRVLFAQDTYIVPKADGRIIVGATVEPGQFDGDVTPSGMMHCMSEATRLVPALADLPIDETWAGLRPTTPDKGPILGKCGRWDNVYLAGGYWRNGVLLAPKTGQLVGDLVVNDGKGNESDGDGGSSTNHMSDADTALLSAFSWDRFTALGGGAALAANARYASQLYPVHKRSGGAGSGVSASVGTELGFYEGAAAARDDRARDRKALFGSAIMGEVSFEDGDAALERAAGLGKGDASAFQFGDVEDGWKVAKGGQTKTSETGNEARSTDAVPDAFTVGSAADDSNEEGSVGDDDDGRISDFSTISAAADDVNDGEPMADLSSVYRKIKVNKAKAGPMDMGEDASEILPDPVFRIHHVDAITNEVIEVPPFTSPAEFFKMKAEGTLPLPSSLLSPPISDAADDDAQPMKTEEGDEEKPSTSYDGYSAIRSAFGECTTKDETAKAMREARMQNRVKSSEIDESKIGALVMSDDQDESSYHSSSTTDTDPSADLSSVYERIAFNKATTGGNVEMGETMPDNRPKLNFTIYHIDSQTGEKRKVPPYTSPREFLEIIEKKSTTADGDAGSKAMPSGAASVQASDPLLEGGDYVEPVDNNDSGSSSISSSGDVNRKNVSGASVEPLVDDGSNEKTYDGYQDIQAANGASSREEELQRMREARKKNRAKASGAGDDLLLL